MASDKDASRAMADKLAKQHAERGDPLGWFDALYAQAGRQAELIPWADLRPNPNLVEWLDAAELKPAKALVVGCGLGDDAELLAARGWSVTAFDISAEAIRWARERFAASCIDFRVANALDLPAEWAGGFDLVVEIFTLQALPPELREQAAAGVARYVARGGLLFVFARARDESDQVEGPPWPLAEREIRAVGEEAGLSLVRLEDFMDEEQPPVRRFRAVFQRPPT